MHIFKKPCPTCGVTRAMLSLLRLDIKGYFSYSPMALPLCVAVLLMLNVDIIKHKRAVYVFSITSAVINLIIYFFRLI